MNRIEKAEKALEERDKELIRIQKEAAETIAIQEEEILELKKQIAMLTNT